MKRSFKIWSGAIPALTLLTSVAVGQQSISKESLINSLRNSASQDAPERKIDVQQLRESLRNGLSVEPTENTGGVPRPNTQVSAALANVPSINITIFFDYNSSAIKPESLNDIMTLGNALSSSELRDGRFVIAGHTDGKGGRDYNIKLSERRSEAVIKMLTAAFPSLNGRLVPIGFGMEQLKDPNNPFDAINRRVQVLNIGR